MKSFKINIGGEQKEVRYKNPNQAQLFRLDEIYRKVFSSAIDTGISTEFGLKKKLAKTGDWTEQDDKEIENLIAQIASIEALLMKQEGSEDQEQVSKNMKHVGDAFELRRHLEQKMMVRSNLFNNTAEGLAKEQRIHMLAKECLVYEEGGAVFEDDNAYQTFLEQEPKSAGLVFVKGFTAELDLDEMPIETEELKYITRQKEFVEKQEKKAKKTTAKKKKVTKKRRAKKAKLA